MIYIIWEMLADARLGFALENQVAAGTSVNGTSIPSRELL
jgi:hypothetical protein